MSSYSVPVQNYMGQTGTANIPPSVQPQQPIQAGLDELEKLLVNLREEVLRLEGRLISIMNVGPPRAEAGGQAQAQNSSALVARLAHLYSLVGDIMQTINTIHTQLEV